MKISGIYKIVNKVNGKYYIGSSINIHRRWNCHKRTLNKNCHRNDYLQNAWNKYGQNNFDFIIVNELSDELLTTEQKYLDEVDKNLCYNLTFIAGGGCIMNEYSIQKMREKITGKNHPMYGKHPHNFGKKSSDETKHKMSLSLRGKGNGFYGKHHSEETKLKMRNSHRLLKETSPSSK